MSRIELSRINRGFVVRSHDHVSRDEVDGFIRDIANAGGGSLRWFVCEPTPQESAAAAAHGLSAGVPLLHMRCKLLRLEPQCSCLRRKGRSSTGSQ